MSMAIAGLSPARLAVLDQVLTARYLDSGRLPGLIMEIWRNGEKVHVLMGGFVDAESRKPMHADAIFRIHSMSKPITGVALLMLMEDGLIDLLDEVAKYVPQWKDLRVRVEGESGSFTTRAPTRPMRLLDLATHTGGQGGGIPALERLYSEMNVGASDTPGGLDSYVTQMARVPLAYSPGEGWHYSNTLAVIGYIVEKLTGMTFGEFLRSRLFGPLGMVDTAFYCPADKVDRLATLYRSAGGTFQREPDGRDWTISPLLENGADGLVSTAADFGRFCSMLLAGGSLSGVHCLSPKSVAMLSTNYLPGNRDVPQMNGKGQFAAWQADGAGISIGCGTVIDPSRRGLPASIGEIEWSGVAATQFWVDPQEDLAVIFLTQVLDFDDFFAMQRLLRTLVYSAFTSADRQA